MEWLTLAGAWVAVPLFHSRTATWLPTGGTRLDRVQVKTSTCWVEERFRVQLSTRGGNQSWNGTIKHLDSSRCDSVFIHVADGRRWYIPASALGGSSCICVAGPKYANFEVEPGAPLQARGGAEREPRR